MQIKYIDTQALVKYSKLQPASELEQVKQGPDGRKYKLLGKSEKTYAFNRRIWFGVRAFVKTLFSLGFGLLLQNIRKDWSKFWLGHKITAVYSPYDASDQQPERREKIKKVSTIGEENIPVSSQKKEPVQQPSSRQEGNDRKTFLTPIGKYQEDYSKSLEIKKSLFKEGLLTPSSSSDFEFKLDVQLTPEQQVDLENAYSKRYSMTLSPSYSILRGGEHLIIILKSLPSVVFKIHSSNKEKTIDKELETFEKAFNLVKKENLNLIKIPRCSKFYLNKETPLLAQERMETDGNFRFQKGLYRFAFEQAELQPIMENCFLQLAKFICLTGFSDVKYDNIPFLFNGKGVGLYDLDQRSMRIGLFTGRARQENGLLNYAPTVPFLHKLVQAIPEFIQDDQQKNEFISKWEETRNDIETRIQQRSLKREKMKTFLANAGIKNARQELDPQRIPYSKDSKIKQVQEVLITHLNKGIKQADNFDLIQSRHIMISVQEVWRENLNSLANLYRGSFFFENDMEPALQELKNAGVIANFKHNKNYHYVAVRC